jgi:hypothetical protein
VVARLHEGDFVVIDNAKIQMPVYAQPFDAVRRGGSLRFGRVSPSDRERAIAYATAIGRSPRVVFNVGARAASDSVPYVDCRKATPATDNARVLVPIKYGLLTEEPSLLTGGELTVLSKVTRVLGSGALDGGAPRRSDLCYTDLVTFNTFRLHENQFPPKLLKALGFSSQTAPRRIGRSLLEDTHARWPAAVVVPVAIFK